MYYYSGMAELSYPGPLHDPADDPYLWLEDIDAYEVLSWVDQHSERAKSVLKTSPRFDQFYDDTLEILDSDDKIPIVSRAGEYLYNFWQDAHNPRGLWRRTILPQYMTDDPEWETLLDIDELAQCEDISWVFKGARLLRPYYDRALVFLSPGGSDAHVIREFDVTSYTFIPDGFIVPAAKSQVNWIDKDTIYIGSDFGEDSLTASGYPRTIRRWTRGTQLADAVEVFTGGVSDVFVSGSYDYRTGRSFFTCARDFYTSDEYYLVENVQQGDLLPQLAFAEPQGQSLQTYEQPSYLVHIDIPATASIDVHDSWLLVRLRYDWCSTGKDYIAGSVIVIDWNDFLSGSRDFTTVFVPDDRCSVLGWDWTKNYLVLTIIKDVCTQLWFCDPSTHWAYSELKGLPDNATAQVVSTNSDNDDEIFVMASSFLVPSTIYYGHIGERVDSSVGIAVNDRGTAQIEFDQANIKNRAIIPQLTPIKSMPEFFDATGFSVQQYYAGSDDGTQIPYFVIGKIENDREVATESYNDIGYITTPGPTLLYGYGGFEVSLTPSYSGAIGKNWLERGGTYVVAGIRGGGEYGPTWHTAALLENRERCYEDFSAVAQDLINRGITTSGLLGAQGGSNGGLLMGVMYTQYSYLFGAIVCLVPLLDMYRYNKLLAGASWVAEYGDPDDPSQWEFIKRYSPYHNIASTDRQYPPILLYTSTKDDRVHPGHARKFFARLTQFNYDGLYYENTEGGHAGSTDNSNRAFMNALIYEFLWQNLRDNTAADQ